MSLQSGALLGPYELLSPIGAGGMGEVFRARDKRLGRIVAIKVLPPHRFAVRDWSARFRREALAISALSHPNVCALFDVGETLIDGETVSWLVMEYLEGETLRDRLKRGALTVRQAIDIGVQIANGLAAAHRKGLIHRDLKPENVFLTRDNVVKILDFGLVKAIDDLEPATTDQKQTQPGTIVGTAAYMAPEQIRGEPVDLRADIFSFGVVLYETLTGLQPFHGETAVDTMSQVLNTEPEELTGFLSDSSAGVSEIVRRCLMKNPDERFASARDLGFTLEAVSFGSGKRRGADVSSGSRKKIKSGRDVRSPLLGIGLVVALALLLVGGRFLTSHRDDAGPPAARPLTHSGKDGAPAASPDGRFIAFVSSRDGHQRVWLEQLADGAEVALTGGPEDWAPRFSPDGATLFFTRATPSGSAIYRVPVLGGEPRKVIDNAFDADISHDGRRIAFIRNRVAGARYSTLCVASSDGSAVKEINATVNEDLASPRWSPDGERIVVTDNPRSTSGGSLLLVSADGASQRVITRAGPHGLFSAAAWTDDGRGLVFTELETVATVSLRMRGGTARVLLYDLSSETFRPILWNAHASADTVDLLPGGRLVFSEDFTRQNMQEVPLDQAGETHWLTRGTAIDRQPSYAPDGSRVVFTSDRSGNPDIWEVVPATGAVRRLTDDTAVDWDPVIAADGHLLWSSSRGGHFEVWSANGDGEAARQVTTDGGDAENPTAPQAADWIYYDSSHREKDGLWRVRPDGSAASMVVRGETAHPAISADGEYVLFHRPDAGGGTWTLVVMRIADGTTFEFARSLRRAARGRWLGMTHTVVFIADEGLMSQEFVPGSDTTAIRRVLVHLDRDTTIETFGISPDGKRAVLSILEPASDLMITNGIEGLTK